MKESDVGSGFVSQAKATCPHCGIILDSQRVREQLTDQNGGTQVYFDEQGKRIGGAIGLTVIYLDPNLKGRQYRAFVEDDYKPVWIAEKRLKLIKKNWKISTISAFPEETINPVFLSIFSPPLLRIFFSEE